jgi:hypothetical protein
MTYGKNSYKGKFTPKNPAKYNGNPDNIIFRSSWELRCMNYFDDHPNIVWWSSEELAIPYVHPLDGRVHRYFPDFIIKVKRTDETVMTHVIEVKPEAQTRKPVQGKRKTQRFLQEAATYAINQMKWKAADEFCHTHGWKFQILTEKDLGLTL